MLEIIANSTHGSTDVLTQVSGVETGHPRATTAVLRSVSIPTEEATSVLSTYVSANMAIRHSVLTLFHSCELMNYNSIIFYLSIQTLYLAFEQSNYAHVC
jgi:hypothetical protein